ncbi:MAG: CBS domain-containing protein [Thermoanaerobaculia bacterium]
MPAKIADIIKAARISELPMRKNLVVEPTTPLQEVYRLMDEGDWSAVVVCRGDKAVGIFSQRDILYRTALEDLEPSTPIEQLMTPDPVTLGIDEGLAAAIKIMVDGGYRHIPILDNKGNTAGVITSREILRHIADHMPETVLNLPPRLHQELHRPDGG